MWFYQPRHVSCSRYFQIPSFILAQSIRNNKSRTIWVWVHLQRSDNKITLTRCNFLHLSDCWLFNATLKILKFICCTLQFLRNTLLIPNLIMLLRYLILSGVRGVLANSVNRQKNYDKFLGFECRKNKFSDHLEILVSFTLSCAKWKYSVIVQRFGIDYMNTLLPGFASAWQGPHITFFLKYPLGIPKCGIHTRIPTSDMTRNFNPTIRIQFVQLTINNI